MTAVFFVLAALLGGLVGLGADYAVFRFAPEGEGEPGLYKLKGIVKPSVFIEIIFSALIFVVIYARFGISVELPFALYISAILTAVFFIDLKYRIIPDEFVLAGIAGGIAALICNIFRPLSFMAGPEWWNPLLGVAVGSGFLFIVALIGMLIYGGEGAMGMGDVKIYAAIGLFLGWKLTIESLFITMFIGGIVSVILLVTKIKGRKDAIPFGPFIVIGALIVLLFGTEILRLYLYGII